MTVDIRAPAFRDVVGDDAELDILGSGFAFTEGPIWHPVAKHLTFSDMPGDHMRRWSAAGIETFRQPSNMANGNAFDPQGRIVTCEHATSRLTRTEADGSITTLASHYDGKELNSPNDVIVKRDGRIYFTDPSFGRMEYYGVPRDCELDFRGVYRVDPANGNDLTLIADDFDQPNGLTFNGDESLLFVNDTMRGHVRVFDVRPDGTALNSRIWCEVTGDGNGAPDGMKTDSEDNLYCTGPGGVHVFDRDATCLGVIHVPEVVANFTWGGDDMCDLFMTASTSLYRCRVKVPGRAAF